MARSQATKVRPRGATAPLETKQAPAANSAQRTAEVTTVASAQIIEQQQSTEVVQTLLHGSVSEHHSKAKNLANNQPLDKLSLVLKVKSLSLLNSIALCSIPPQKPFYRKLL